MVAISFLLLTPYFAPQKKIAKLFGFTNQIYSKKHLERKKFVISPGIKKKLLVR